MKIAIAQSAEEIDRCFPVIRQLRPHLTPDRFREQVKRQREKAGYTLVTCHLAGELTAVAGYRVSEFLAWGNALYVDDLVTAESSRKMGCAGALVDWLMEKARELGCDAVHLDSGVQRFDAHRLYLAKQMNITSHHFARRLK